MHNELHSRIDEMRAKKGFLKLDQAMMVVGEENTILDPYSLLVGRHVVVGKGNIFYPNVVIECPDNEIQIGDNNIFYPGTFILATSGVIIVGNANTFGPNGCAIRANMAEARIIIGSHGRYCDGANIVGVTDLGDGSQILGAITAQNCQLAAGGSFEDPDPEMRAAVLKGYGLARGISLEQGQVVNGTGDFSNSLVERQSAYHPKS